jgi:hypothetical protein
MAVRLGVFATAAFRFVLVALLALVVLCGVAWVVALLVGWWQGDDWRNTSYLGIGLLCTLIAALFFAVFHLRRETRTMPVGHRDQFIAKAKSVLHEMGYALTTAHGDTLTFRPRFHSYLLGDAIQISLDNQEAKLTGPRVALDIFRRYLRLMNHVQRVQVYLKDQRKFTDNVLKRVDLMLRLRPDQFEAVTEHVIEVFEKDGNVLCELNLKVDCERGFNANTLEFQIIEWLEQHGIYFEIRKNLVQFVEVAHNEIETEATPHP